jgi:hypothetical protein
VNSTKLTKTSQIRENRESSTREPSHFQGIVIGLCFAMLRDGNLLMLKIKRSTNGKVGLTPSGRIETEDVAVLKRLFALEVVDNHPASLVPIAVLSSTEEAARNGVRHAFPENSHGWHPVANSLRNQSASGMLWPSKIRSSSCSQMRHNWRRSQNSSITEIWV